PAPRCRRRWAPSVRGTWRSSAWQGVFFARAGGGTSAAQRGHPAGHPPRRDLGSRLLGEGLLQRLIALECVDHGRDQRDLVQLRVLLGGGGERGLLAREEAGVVVTAAEL